VRVVVVIYSEKRKVGIQKEVMRVGISEKRNLPAGRQERKVGIKEEVVSVVVVVIVGEGLCAMGFSHLGE